MKPIWGAVAFGTLLTAALPALADVKAGVDAWQQGDYAKAIAAALSQIRSASLQAMTKQHSDQLNLAILPTFGTRWLAPRLPDFLSAHPGVTVNLTTRFTRFDFAAERFDAMIYYGSDDWPGAAHLKLFDERLTACASPALLTAHPVAGPADLHGMVLLQLATRSDAWAAWFRGQGAAPPARIDGMVMDQFSMMVQAAISGLGVALLPDYLARPEIAEGRLVPILRPGVAGPGAYWLAWPEDRAEGKPLQAFRDWLGRSIAAAP